MSARHQKWQPAYLSLGSNLGNRKRNLARAIQLLQRDPKFRIEKIASIYKTSPVGPKQRNFLNTALKAKTSYSPAQLLFFLKKIEKQMGRKKTQHWGPRPIDLDIIFYEKRCMKTKQLTLPHPEFFKRKFVLAPLSEIAPNFVPPGFKKNLLTLKAKLTDSKQKVKFISSPLVIPASARRGGAGTQTLTLSM